MTSPSKAYRRIQQHLAALGWACPGSVQKRVHLGARRLARPVCQWTRKVKGKTVTTNLTPDQYRKFKRAIVNQRHMARMIRKMHALTIQWVLGAK